MRKQLGALTVIVMILVGVTPSLSQNWIVGANAGLKEKNAPSRVQNGAGGN